MSSINLYRQFTETDSKLQYQNAFMDHRKYLRGAKHSILLPDCHNAVFGMLHKGFPPANNGAQQIFVS